MKRLFLILSIIVWNQSLINAQELVRLYDGKAPGSEDCNYKEIEFKFPGETKRMIRNVVDPTLEVFMPEKGIATGTAVIIAPGGGNMMLDYDSEGVYVAEWFAQKGITAFVLKYRLNKTPEDIESFYKEFFEMFSGLMNAEEGTTNGTSKAKLNLTNEDYVGGKDGIKAMEYVRQHAADYGIDPNKIGIMGFSAGAWVTIYTVMNASPANMPNFAAPIYGGWTGDSKIPENAPPLFICAAADDPIAVVCPDLYDAWKAAGKDVEMHMYSKGGHGFGMKKQNLPIDNWINVLYDWMKFSGF